MKVVQREDGTIFSFSKTLAARRDMKVINLSKDELTKLAAKKPGPVGVTTASGTGSFKPPPKDD